MRLDSVPHSVLGPRSMVAQWRGKVSGGGGGGGTGVGSGLEGETRADLAPIQVCAISGV